MPSAARYPLVNIRVNAEQRDRMHEAAQAAGVSLSGYVRTAVAKAMAKDQQRAGVGASTK